MAGHFSSLLAVEGETGDRVPVTVLTGFLGSGKTTLLNRLLSQSNMQGTVVIVNEFGEIGIDHDLITHTAEDTVLLANGCMCCAVRGDLVEALCGLAESMGQRLQRVLIETSGLADPAPILRVLMGDTAVTRSFSLSGVACTVDSVLGLKTLGSHAEAARQVAVADLLFLTKADLEHSSGDLDRLHNELVQINPDAALVADRSEQVGALKALMKRSPVMSESNRGLKTYRPVSSASGVFNGSRAPVHAGGISSFVLTRDTPLPLEPFAHWMDVVVASRGTDLLRVKGLVKTTDDPDRPLLVHGVQHLFPPPERLPAWPSEDTRTRLVFITRGLDADALSDTLDVMVRQHARRTSA